MGRSTAVDHTPRRQRTCRPNCRYQESRLPQLSRALEQQVSLLRLQPLCRELSYKQQRWHRGRRLERCCCSWVAKQTTPTSGDGKAAVCHTVVQQPQILPVTRPSLSCLSLSFHLVPPPPKNTPTPNSQHTPKPKPKIAGATEFSLDVATTVLRCYQLQPASANKELIAKTLLRALMQLPRPDYKVCIHLLPERLVVS